MRIHYGQVLTVFTLFASALGSYYDDVLAGLSPTDLKDLIGQNDYLDYGNGLNLDYGLDYNPKEDDDIIEPIDVRADGSMAPGGKAPVNDVPKTEPVKSQATASPTAAANAMLPAYCDPPNPCPPGYTEAEGCIENFENTSEFSRRFQATQNCICDTEHMFNCPEDSARRTQNDIDTANFLAGIPGMESANDEDNPFLSGQKLPVAAKKGML